MKTTANIRADGSESIDSISDTPAKSPTQTQRERNANAFAIGETGENDAVTLDSQDNNADNANPTSKKTNEKERLLASVKKRDVVLFHDTARQPFALVARNNTRRAYLISSGAFAELLSMWFYEDYGAAVNDNALRESVSLLKARAKFDGAERPVWVRVGHGDGKVYLDLCRDKNSVVEIDALGWRITDDAPIAFRYQPTMTKLPIPVRGGSLDALSDLLRLDEDSLVLLVAFLLSVFQPSGERPVLALQGPQGSGKTTTARITKSLVDPSASVLLRKPQNEKDVLIAASNNLVVSFDNLSGGATGWFSDVVCSVASGTGLSERELYTNFDEVSIAAKCSIILNGIDGIAKASDLAERTLTINLSQSKFVSSDSIEKRFQKLSGLMLGALLDAVSEALKRLPAVRAEPWRRPRLADFAEWVVAAEPVLPWSSGSFLRVLNESQRHQRSDMLEGDVLLEGIRTLLDREGVVRGTATDLLDKLRKVVKWDKSLPGNARALSAYLNRVQLDYERVAGIRITMNAGRDVKNRKLIEVALLRHEAPETKQNGLPESRNGDSVPNAKSAILRYDLRSERKPVTVI